MNDAMNEQEIEGILEKILFRNEENGWSVIQVIAEPSKSLVTATGTLMSVEAGNRLVMRGRWVDKEAFGRQFQMSTCLPKKPETLEGIREYLASGFIKGVGRDTARKLTDAFGLEIVAIIERDPMKLTDIPGIGRKKARMIHAGWKEHHEMSDIMIFLQSHGISATYAHRIFKLYGREAPRLIRENPYRLCFDISGIGFKIADRIAGALGVSRESPGRAKAGIVFTLGEVSENGHVCFPLGRLVEKAAALLSVSGTVVRDAIVGIEQSGHVKVEDFSGERYVYLASLFDAEERIAASMKALLAAPSRIRVQDLPSAVKWFEESCGMQLAERQRDALKSALTEKVLVITGGPGTGKTTLIKGIIEICERRGFLVHLCAPTGRASKRMSEATGREAKTIHRLFEISAYDGPGYFDEGIKLKSDMLIIDEASMVDALLFSRVLMGVEPETKLVLVGDADQLPSVGPGNVLMDIIRSGLVHTVRLTDIFRQAQMSLIVVNAHRINRGVMPRERQGDEQEDYYFIRRDNPEEILEVVKELVAVRIPKRFGFDPFKDIQVLSPMHKGMLGVDNLNHELKLLLNPSGRELTIGSRQFGEGDRVMQLKNNYDHGIYNGDMGIITFVDPGKRIMDVDFEDKIVRYEGTDMEELALSYACSIHKSQGSEYRAIVLVLHTGHGIMLQRNLLYTAVTRGRSLVAVVGNVKAVEIATANMRRAERYTLLAERLQKS